MAKFWSKLGKLMLNPNNPSQLGYSNTCCCTGTGTGTGSSNFDCGQQPNCSSGFTNCCNQGIVPRRILLSFSGFSNGSSPRLPCPSYTGPWSCPTVVTNYQCTDLNRNFVLYQCEDINYAVGETPGSSGANITGCIPETSCCFAGVLRYPTLCGSSACDLPGTGSDWGGNYQMNNVCVKFFCDRIEAGLGKDGSICGSASVVWEKSINPGTGTGTNGIDCLATHTLSLTKNTQSYCAIPSTVTITPA